MKNPALFIVLLFSIINPSFSQTVIKWQKTIGGTSGDVLRVSQQTSDGGYILGGTSYSSISGDKTENNLGIVDYWIVKLDALGNIQWQNTIGGSDWDELFSIDQTVDGGYILGGASSSNISGDKTENSKGSKDYWVVKLDDSGNIQWQKTIGGSYEDDLYSVHQTADHGYILGGTSYSNISGDKTENALGEMDYWIVKLDSVGNIVWQNTIGGNSFDQYCTVEPASDGGYILGGLTDSGISGDKTEGDIGGWDYWIVKLDSLGNIVWQNTIGGNSDDEFMCIHQTSDGGYILGGTSPSNISGDKTENSIGFNDYWVIKLDASGNIVWQNTIGGDQTDYLLSIRQTTDGGYITGGYSNSSISGDKTQHCKGEYDYWIVKLDSSGNVQWQNTFGGSSIDYLTDVQQTSDGEYFAGGWSYSSLSADKTDDSWGGTDYWVMKLTETYNLATGNMFFDLNSNSIQDAGEPAVANQIVTEANTGRFSFSDSAGFYSVSVLDTGNFSVSPPAINYYNAEPPLYNISFTGINQVDSLNDFAFQPAGAFNDLSIVLTPINDFDPGFEALYSIDYSDVGTTSLAGKIVFYPDANLSYVSASTTPDLITPDSIVWNTSVLSPFETGSILLTLNVSVNAVVGSSIYSSVVIDPVNDDADTVNNHSSWSSSVVASVDPNEMLVDIDTLDVSELLSPPYLEYIINFQNTGTDTAVNVKVSDRMPYTLDMPSFELVASSSPVEINFNAAMNKLEFHFNNIQLPDSGVNEPESHGFIRYKIKPVSTLLSGDTIINNASIFFDFNSAVKTNDALTQIVLATSTNDILSSSSGLKLFPNPASKIVTLLTDQLPSEESQWQVYDVYGREVFSLKTKNQKQLVLDVSKFAAGIYVVQLQTGGKCFSEKMVKE